MDDPMARSVEEAFDSISTAAPEGWRVELIEGEIHVTPPANGEHEEIVSELTGQVRDQRRKLGRYTGLGLNVPGASVTGKVIPDLVVAPKGAFVDQEEYHDPAPVLLVGEVTSTSTAEKDRAGKLRGYAAAGVPLYLLVDRQAGTVRVYSEPLDGRYTHLEETAFAKTLTLPEPLAIELDTSEF
ncbi:Uma2 family endonuclease [Streptomyces sp. DSM 42041]|uniref:Uma2 family endonuclease n=1 Tax=Streptomyces hazeniae TaxID=3075538 RepID=A0ABU2NMJ6_9ACTN|nr:Uma2 family endonuclease [Streptomyces sp. DSM 42041]MDT0377965.1 Uma2 family endonuclease [Streptomyces sp. DSM 42041]